MRDNPIQFAVVREDPLLEAEIINQYQPHNLLTVCSGGCSVLSLKSLFPQLEISAFDLNLSQIQLTKDKNHELSNSHNFNEIFNIEDDSSLRLNQRGNFESLFKGLREFIFDFIVDYENIRSMMLSSNEISKISKYVFEHKYWPVAFELFFHDSVLRTMFGQAAIQHAPEGSYPQYFKTQFERAFTKSNAHQNYFLHHVFLGHYLKNSDSLPYYLISPKSHEGIEYIQGELSSVENIGQYDFIQLSNIMDWMSESENFELANVINQNIQPGTVILIRQLNNKQPVLKYFPDFKLDTGLSTKLLEADRSIFYSSILCLVRR